MRLHWIGLLSTVLVGACSSLPQPKLGVLDCQARDDCVVVRVNAVSSRYPAEIRFNGRKYTDVDAYGTAVFTVYTTNLLHGNCGVVSARLTRTPGVGIVNISSTEECIRPGQYYEADISTVPLKVWLTALR